MPDDALLTGKRRPHASFVAVHDRRLFLWHHPPLATRRRAAAIVMCPAIGYEYMSAYRSWRLLAERLADRGFDVIRFDYDGTGNSTGGPEDPNRLDAWLGSVAAAIENARRLGATDRIALVGLRAGSLLALQVAASSGAVERLALWSPFASGRGYVRELKAVARLNGQAGEADGPGINAEGHNVTEDTVDSLLRWSLNGIAQRPAPHVILLERDDRRADGDIDAHLQALGCRVDRHSVPGTAEMLLPPHLAKVPEHALDTIVNWFEPWHASPTPEPLESQGDGHRASILARAIGYDEHPVQFGPEQRLFGIMTRPPTPRRSTPSIILLSTGAGHHVGPHRLYVPLAREWACDGHLVFRFDLGGIGDSIPPRSAAGGDAYPRHMMDDAREAIAFVKKEAPDQPVILMGLCSGGWLAFEAARTGLPIDAIISINPPLYLRDGGRGWVQQQRQFDRYQRSIRNPMKWLKALRSGAAREAARAIARRAGRDAAMQLRRFSDPLPNGLARDLHTIACNKITMFFIFSDGDNGHRYFEQHAPPALRRADVREHIHQVVVDDAGHVFRPLSAQRRLKSLLYEFVCRLSTPVELGAQNATFAQNTTVTRRPV